VERGTDPLAAKTIKQKIAGEIGSNVVPLSAARRHQVRPRSKAHDLIFEEAKRRMDADENFPGALKAFVAELAHWFHCQYPDEETLADSTIETLVRPVFQKWKQQKERPQK